MRALVIGLALLAIGSQAQAGDGYVIDAKPSEQQVVRWVDGFATIQSTQPQTRVVFTSRQLELPGKPSTFALVVFNATDEHLTFGPENVALELENGTKVAMIDPTLLDTKLRRDIKRRKALAALGGALSAGSANGYTSGTFSYSGTNAYGGNVSGTGTYSGYDPALAAAEQRQVREQTTATNQAIQARREAGEETLNWLIRKTTVEPGKGAGGWVAFEWPSPKPKRGQPIPVRVVVTTGQEEHKFDGLLSAAD
jgi:hypothetical protein